MKPQIIPRDLRRLLVSDPMVAKSSKCNGGCYLDRNSDGIEYCLGCGRTMARIKENYAREPKRNP